jgi:3-hydroxyacyl-[acyl-carrier-protein] dehydratase
MNLSSFKMLDTIIEMSADNKVALTATTVPNAHPILNNHFPGSPILPGIFILEYMAQSAGYTIMAHNQFAELAILAKSGGCKFSAKVLPGEKLFCRVDIINHGRGFALVSTQVYTEEKPVSSSELRMKLLEFPNKETRDFVVNSFNDLSRDMQSIGAHKIAALA